jgi:hypothetical protein
MALKKPATTDRSMDPIRIARPEQSRQEMRQEKRAYRKAQSLTKPQLNLTTKEMAVFFAQQNKLS